MRKALLLLLVALPIFTTGCGEAERGMRRRQSQLYFKFMQISEGMTRDEVSILLTDAGTTLDTEGNKVTRKHNYIHSNKYHTSNRYIVVVFVSGGLVHKAIYDGDDNCLDTREFKETT